MIVQNSYRLVSYSLDEFILQCSRINEEKEIESLISNVTRLDENKLGILSEKNQEKHLNWINENEEKLKALWKYGYRLYYVADVKEETYNEIAQFIKSGILI